MRTVRWTRSTHGQALVVFALALTCLLGFMALSIDLGYAYGERRHAQNGADAAALAGAQALALGRSVDPAVSNLAQQNGVAVQSFSTNGQRVTVTTQQSFNTFFAAVLGQKQWTVSAVATAAYGSPASVGGIFPLAVHDQNLTYGADYTLLGSDPQPPGQFKLGPGNFGWLNFDGNGASKLGNWILNGYPGPTSVDGGVNIKGDPGLKTGVKSELTQRMNMRDSAGNPIPVILLIYDDTSGQGANFTYHCIAYAAFILTDVQLTGNNKHITGKFVERYVTPGLLDPSVTPGKDGVYAVGLTN